MWRALMVCLLLVAWPLADVGAQQQGTISGRVSDQSGQPLAGVQVLVDGTELGSLSDVQGRYEITGVAAGEVTVSARARPLARPGARGSVAIRPHMAHSRAANIPARRVGPRAGAGQHHVDQVPHTGGHRGALVPAQPAGGGPRARVRSRPGPPNGAVARCRDPQLSGGGGADLHHGELRHELGRGQRLRRPTRLWVGDLDDRLLRPRAGVAGALADPARARGTRVPSPHFWAGRHRDSAAAGRA